MLVVQGVVLEAFGLTLGSLDSFWDAKRWMLTEECKLFAPADLAGTKDMFLEDNVARFLHNDAQISLTMFWGNMFQYRASGHGT